MKQNSNAYIQETVKNIEIFGNAGDSRYIIDLMKESDTGYTVTVYDSSAEDPKLILTESFDVYEDAVGFFETQEKNYADLVKSEEYDINDIRLYADKTGYARTGVDCCLNCEWSVPCDAENCVFRNFSPDLSGKYICMNSELYRPRNIINGKHGPVFSDERDKFGDRVENKNIIRPVVEFDGLCLGYIRKRN